MHRLQPSEYDIARPVVDGLDHALMVTAVIERTLPGTVAVDDRQSPRAVFAADSGAHYLIGDTGNEAFNTAVGRAITDEIIPRGREDGWAVFNLHYYPEHWEPLLDTLFTGTVVVKNYQRYFQFRQRRVEWRECLPAGFGLRRLDTPLLQEKQLKNIDRIESLSEDYADGFQWILDRGFGFCLVHGDEIATWCSLDCASGQRCELGVQTIPAYRGRGLATLVVAAMVDDCLANGWSRIGWHCWSQNLASAATAVKVGFEEVLHHHAVHIWLNPVDGLLVNGNLALMRGQYREAAEFYERGLALRAQTAGQVSLLDWRSDEARYLYHQACAWALTGEPAAAQRSLERALGRGGFRQSGY